MKKFPSDVASTPAVKSIQKAKGSRASYAKVEQGRGWQTRATPDLAEFLTELDMFYLGTANAEGQPYIQHRGGSHGFLKVLDEKTLGFADFSGNRQYITLGNLSEKLLHRGQVPLLVFGLVCLKPLATLVLGQRSKELGVRFGEALK